MALALSRYLIPALAVLRSSLVAAETHTFDWEVGWLTANPDALADRPVIGINGQWPLPLVNVTKGDRIVVNLQNGLGNQSTSLHFHGMYQNGTNHMDGPVGVTQCDLPPGHNMTYNFTVDQPGNYWYHSHSTAQYADGLRGPFVVNDLQNPYRGMFDDEISLTLSDWYHEQGPTLLKQFISVSNPTGAEPVPNAALMNDTQNLTIPVQPGKTYYFRLVNMAFFAGQHFWIEGHNMTIIDVDGVYTEPAEASMIYLGAAQRYGFLVTMKNDTSTNFVVNCAMDTDLFDVVPDSLNPNVTGWLVYSDQAAKPDPVPLDQFSDFDDFTLVPQDGLGLFDNVDHSITLDLMMQDLGDGANYAFFNDVTYTQPVVPTLYTALSSGNMANNTGIYGNYTNSFVMEKGQVAEIILNNDDAGTHPFHLHGHNFQVAVRSDDNWGDFDPTNHTAIPDKPMRRDTVVVRPNSNLVIRWRVDNPGIWFFHCHISWHLASGLAATIVAAPMELQASLNGKIPQNHYDACAAQQQPTKGNAAGNMLDLLDLSGQNVPPAPLPAGFETKGIVALVFSCLAAFLGLAVIVWYGWAPLSSAEMASTREFIAQQGVSTR